MALNTYLYVNGVVRPTLIDTGASVSLVQAGICMEPPTFPASTQGEPELSIRLADGREVQVTERVECMVQGVQSVNGTPYPIAGTAHSSLPMCCLAATLIGSGHGCHRHPSR